AKRHCEPPVRPPAGPRINSAKQSRAGRICPAEIASSQASRNDSGGPHSMCTSIVEIVDADGAGKGEDGEWFNLTHAVVAYDHPHHALLEEAITIDFVNRTMGPGARVAAELTLDEANALSAALQRALAQ